jgi:thiol:disulfide interchange protein
MSNLARASLAASVLLVAAGCRSESAQTEPAADKIELSIGDRAALDALVKLRRGKVVLVDYWAHWCVPCVENFPHVVALGRKNSGRGLAVITVNMDAPEAAEKTLAFLTANQAGVATHLISQFGGSPQSMEAFEIPGGALPCYKLFDRSGRLQQTFALDPAAKTQFTIQDVDAAIEKLLAE